MMDRFREGLKGPLAWVFLVVIIVPFIFGGISNFFVGGDTDVVATVDGEKIRNAEFQRTYQSMRDRYGEMFDRIFSTAEKQSEFRTQVLDMLIDREALSSSFKDIKLTVSLEDAAERAKSIPAFQVDGKFNRQRAEQLLLQNGYTIDAFQAQLQQDMMAEQLLRGLSETAFVLPNEGQQFYQFEQEQRSGRFIRVKTSDFRTQDQPADADVTAWYESHKDEYKVPEQLSLQYVELKGADLSAQVTIDDAEISSYYDLHKQEYVSGEKRRVAHILLTLANDAAADIERSVRQQADDIKARLDKGEDFAALAKEFSQDPVSKENGGELDVMQKSEGESIVDPAFDSAAFALTADKPISAVVRSQFGLHLIKLLDVMAGETLPLDQVKEDIVAALKREKVSNLFAEKQKVLTDKAYEIADTLDEAAKAAGLTVQETPRFLRDQPTGVAQLPGVVEAAVSEEVLNEKRNSSLLSVGEEHVMVVRVKEYVPASTKPLSDVRPQIVLALQDDAARKAAQAWGATILTRVKAGEDVTASLTEKNLGWESFEAITRNSPAPDALVRAQLFKIAKPSADKPALAGVVLNNGDYVVAQIDKTMKPEVSTLTADQQKSYDDRLSRHGGEADYRGFIKTQKTLVKIVRNDSAMKTADTASQ